MVGVDKVFYWPLFLMVFAHHGVFLFGPKRSILYAALVLALVFIYLQLTGEAPIFEDVVLLVFIGPSAAFFIVVCAAILSDPASQGSPESLGRVENLPHRALESAHLDLGCYAARVGELSVSEERTRVARGQVNKAKASLRGALRGAPLGAGP